MNQTELARGLAKIKHNGQFRNDGVTPYFSHVSAVADGVEERLKPIAYLHDIVEDGHMTSEELIQYGFQTYIVDAVRLLTKTDGIVYDDYVENLLTSQDAVVVKISDIKHNLSDSPSEKQRTKYLKTLDTFQKYGYVT